MGFVQSPDGAQVHAICWHRGFLPAVVNHAFIYLFFTYFLLAYLLVASDSVPHHLLVNLSFTCLFLANDTFTHGLLSRLLSADGDEGVGDDHAAGHLLGHLLDGEPFVGDRFAGGSGLGETCLDDRPIERNGSGCSTDRAARPKGDQRRKGERIHQELSSSVSSSCSRAEMSSSTFLGSVAASARPKSASLRISMSARRRA